MSVETLAQHQQSVVEELLVHPDAIRAEEIHENVTTIDVDSAQLLATPSVHMNEKGNTTTQYLLGIIEHGPNTTLGVVGAVVEGDNGYRSTYFVTELGKEGTHAIAVAHLGDTQPQQPLVDGKQSRLQMMVNQDPDDGRWKFAVRTDPSAQHDIDDRRLRTAGSNAIEGNTYMLLQANEQSDPTHPVLEDIATETWALPPAEVN